MQPWNHGGCRLFVTGFFHFTRFQGSSMWQNMSAFTPFYCSCKMWHVYVVFYLSLHQLMDFWFFPFVTIMNNAFINIYAQGFVWMYAFVSLATYVGVEFLGRMATLCLTFEELPNVFWNGCVTLYSHQQCMMVFISPYPW